MIKYWKTDKIYLKKKPSTKFRQILHFEYTIHIGTNKKGEDNIIGYNYNTILQKNLPILNYYTRLENRSAKLKLFKWSSGSVR